MDDMYRAGFLAGLERAKARLMCAPVMIHGDRRTDFEGTFPRVLDHAKNPDGDPTLVVCTYSLRDAVLHWIEKDRAALIDGQADG